MNTLLFLATLAVGSPDVPAPGPVIRPFPPDDLADKLVSWFRTAARAAPGTWGIAIADQDGRLLWGINPTQPLIPASTVKIFTTGFARSVVGPNARQLTRVLGSGSLDSATGTWAGTWALELNGDITLERGDREGPTLIDLARRLSENGVKRLTGPLVVRRANGDSAHAEFPEVWARRHWGRSFAPMVGDITLNENAISLTVAPGSRPGEKPVLAGSSPHGLGPLVTIRARTVAGSRNRLAYSRQASGHWVVSGSIGVNARPRTYTGISNNPRAVLEAAWASAVSAAGIEWVVTDAVGARSSEDTSVVLAQVQSLPFDSVAREVNARSLNIGAELMLRWAAGDSGAARLTEHVKQVTGDYTGVHLVDGSGLSSEDRASPWSFVSYLAAMSSQPGGQNFPQLLPANGTGTLRRLRGGPMTETGVVRAKTGTLGNAATLAGYLGTPDGVLVFSLMYNGPRVYDARQQQWRLFRTLGATGVVIPIDVSEALGGTE